MAYNKRFVASKIAKLEKLTGLLYMDDLNKLYNQMPDLQQQAEDLLSGWYITLPEVLEDAAHAMKEELDEATYEVQEMVDKGWADEGYEDRVYEQMEDRILPQVADAIDTFEQEFKDYSKGR